MTEDEIKQKMSRIQELLNKEHTDEGRSGEDEGEAFNLGFELLTDFLCNTAKIAEELNFQSIELQNINNAIRSR